jgi:glycosyltransferase involved in cell wall biosynthesis
LLSVIVLTLDEEKHIAACLASVRAFADELLVFDSGVDERMTVLAAQAGARVEIRPFDNYAAQRNAALEAASGDWIFFIDADERASAALGQEICQAISHIENTMSDEALFWVPRKNIIFGEWIRHTGWSPDYQPRVLKKGRAWFDAARPVHELVITQGTELYLQQPLIHYNYDTLAQFRAKQDRYTRFESQMLYAEGIRPRLRSYVGMPIREFFRRYVGLKGYRDGAHGLLLSSLMAYYALKRQVWLGEERRGNK